LIGVLTLAAPLTIIIETFYSDTDIASLQQIHEALRHGKLQYCVGKGFHDRNKDIARCDIMLAFTFDDSDVPLDGGTRYTWDQCTSSFKYHIVLPS